MSSAEYGYGTLILAASTLIVAIAVVIKRCGGMQLGTCCKLTLRETPAIQEPPELQSTSTIANAILPVVDSVIRRLSRDGNYDGPPPPPPPVIS